ncbi:hypothetical protein X975_02264, partial [Stegodyphus mimosarum]
MYLPVIISNNQPLISSSNAVTSLGKPFLVLRHNFTKHLITECGIRIHLYELRFGKSTTEFCCFLEIICCFLIFTLQAINKSSLTVG